MHPSGADDGLLSGQLAVASASLHFLVTKVPIQPIHALLVSSVAGPAAAQDDLTIPVGQQMNLTYLVRNLTSGDPSE